MQVWTTRFRELYDKAVALYRGGNRQPDSYFNAAETADLASIGIRPMYVYDLVEDFLGGGEPDWDTAVLIVSARRDYFLFHQKSKQSALVVDPAELPARDTELGGIRWLPRLLVKARCFLEGGLCQDIMYTCGGDRSFFSQHNLHPADFLRTYWATEGDEKRMLRYVQSQGREF